MEVEKHDETTTTSAGGDTEDMTKTVKEEPTDEAASTIVAESTVKKEEGKDTEPTIKMEQMEEDAKASAASSDERKGDAGTTAEKETTVAAAEASATTTTTATTTPHWDHSGRKVMVQNLFKFWDGKYCRKLVDRWIKAINENKKEQQQTTVEIDKLKKPPKENWMTITLKADDMAPLLIEYVNNPENKILNKHGHFLFAKLAGQEQERKRQRDDNDDNGDGKNVDGDDDRDNNDRRGGRDGDNSKRQRRGDNKTDSRDQKLFLTARTPVSLEQVKDSVIPLWKLANEEQLGQKMKKMINKSAILVTKEIKSRCRSLASDKNRREKFKQNNEKDKDKKSTFPFFSWLVKPEPIKVDDIIPVPSPIRNKCEFTFGYRYEYEDGDAVVESSPPPTATDSNPAGDETKIVKKENNDGDVAMDEKIEKEGKDANDGGDAAAVNEENAQESKAEEEKQRPIKSIPSVGFMARGWAGGVARPHGCANIPPEMCAVVDLVEQQFLSTSPLPPYDTKSRLGVWKFLTIRTSRRTHECMIIITHVSKQQLTEQQALLSQQQQKEAVETTPAASSSAADDDCKKEIPNDTPAEYEKYFDSEKERLLKLLTEAEFPGSATEEPPLKVTSIYFQEYDGVSNPTPDHPVEHVFGKTALQEQLGKCSFQISPGAFFQVNTIGAELLYNKVVQEVKAVSGDDAADTLLFDVCCGTGTIGLCCLKEGVVGRVVGVDISAPAIEDAKKNAALNGFEDCDDGAGEVAAGGEEEEEKESGTKDSKVRFVAARAEAVLSKEIGKARKRGAKLKFVAVVDPAREGLHTEVVKTLRSAKEIDRIVYVSCNPTGSLVRDAALLCAPATKRYCGRPFKVTSACPVDMFPMTDHCEMVMVFDRLTRGEEDYEE